MLIGEGVWCSVSSGKSPTDSVKCADNVLDLTVVLRGALYMFLGCGIVLAQNLIEGFKGPSDIKPKYG